MFTYFCCGRLKRLQIQTNRRLSYQVSLWLTYASLGMIWHRIRGIELVAHSRLMRRQMSLIRALLHRSLEPLPSQLPLIRILRHLPW